MKASFWHQRWETNQIGFHKDAPNPLLIDYLPALGLTAGERIFVPLCGKTLDIPWLLSQGFRVVGAELSVLAVQQLFVEMDVRPKITEQGPLTRYAADNITIFAGDIFDMSAQTLGPVGAVYDRAALVALPAEMRTRYAAHLSVITQIARQLLITFDYDQSKMDGPPFSVPADEVARLHGPRYAMRVLHRAPVAGGLKGGIEAEETVWRLN